MAAVYTNKFVIERVSADLVRLAFSDERNQIKEGIPKAISASAELIMTRENAVELADLIKKIAG
jgi:hypothetical protein